MTQPFDLLQNAIAQLLGTDAGFPGFYLSDDPGEVPGDFDGQIPVLARRPRKVENDLVAAISATGLAAWVMPPVPEQTVRTVSATLFYSRVNVTLRVFEVPALNQTGWDIYDALWMIPRILHWTTYSDPSGRLLTQKPLQVSDRPAELIERASLEDLQGVEAKVANLFFDCAMAG